MRKIVDAIKELGANPSHGEVSALALVSIAQSLEHIAVALEKRQAAVTSWIAWHGHHVRPWENLDPKLTVRVQFQSKPDHIETYYLDSSEIDWTDVIAYQIVNRSE